MENIAIQKKSQTKKFLLLEIFPSLTSHILLKNKPNPFQKETLIQFNIPQMGNVKIKIQDSLGEVIATLLCQRLPRGEYQICWDCDNLPAGGYLCVLYFNDLTEILDMDLLG